MFIVTTKGKFTPIFLFFCYTIVNTKTEHNYMKEQSYMLEQFKRNKLFSLTTATLLLTIILSLLFYREISLLHFINISFYFCYAYISIGILLFIVNKGFFDGISYSFRRLLRRNNKEEESEITPLSEIVAIPHSLLLKSGIILVFIMCIGLVIYY